MTARRLTWLAAGLLVLTGSVSGQGLPVPCPQSPPHPPKRPCPPLFLPAPVTPPPVMGVPVPPSPTPSPSDTPSPTNTPAPTTPTAPTPDEGRQSPERGGASAARRSPNLFGDQGIAPFGPIGTTLLPGQRPMSTFTIGGFFTEGGTNTRTIFPIVQNGSRFVTPPNTSSFGTPITTDFFASGPLQIVANERRFPLQENLQNRAAFNAAAQSRFGPATGAGLVYRTDISRAVVQPGTQNGIDPSQGANVATFYDYTTFTAPVAPLPGFLVGRTKISEDNNPLPRDRFILTYDYFSNTPLGTTTSVNRYSFGVEKTFFEQNASIEVRLPVAYTLSSDVLTDGLLSNTTELGNLRLTFKALAYGGEVFNVGLGLGVTLPTADDIRVRLSNDVDLVRIRNQAIILSPFLGALYTPNERFFAQTFVAFNFDTNGVPVDAAVPDQVGMRPMGRVSDQTLSQIDSQIGYWLIPPGRPSGWLRGLAPFMELHYNAALNKADVLMVDTLFGRRVQIGQDFHLNELNVTGGMLTQLGENFYLMLGVVSPLKKAPDRTFDYQIGVRGSYFFGATARSMNAATAPSSF